MALSAGKRGTATQKPANPKRKAPKITDAGNNGRSSQFGGPVEREIGNRVASEIRAGGGSDPAYTMANVAAPFGSSGYPRNVGTDKTETPFGDTIAGKELGNAWKDPQALVTQYFKFRDLSQLGGGYAQALDDSQRAGLLYLLLNNNTPGGLEQFGNAGPVDWFGRYLDQGARPGSAGVGAQDIASGIFNAREGTPVYDALYNTPQTPQEQIDNWINTLSSGLQGTMPEPIYQALMARYQQAGRDFAARRLEAPNGATSFGDYLDKVGLGADRYNV